MGCKLCVLFILLLHIFFSFFFFCFFVIFNFHSKFFSSSLLCLLFREFRNGTLPLHTYIYLHVLIFSPGFLCLPSLLVHLFLLFISISFSCSLNWKNILEKTGVSKISRDNIGLSRERRATTPYVSLFLKDAFGLLEMFLCRMLEESYEGVCLCPAEYLSALCLPTTFYMSLFILLFHDFLIACRSPSRYLYCRYFVIFSNFLIIFLKTSIDVYYRLPPFLIVL